MLVQLPIQTACRVSLEELFINQKKVTIVFLEISLSRYLYCTVCPVFHAEGVEQYIPQKCGQCCGLSMILATKNWLSIWQSSINLFSPKMTGVYFRNSNLLPTRVPMVKTWRVPFSRGLGGEQILTNNGLIIYSNNKFHLIFRWH